MTNTLARPAGPTSKSRLYKCLAVLLPLAVALAFSHPTRRIVIPDSITLAIAVVLTLLAGRRTGLLAILSAAVFLWFFNYPPGDSFVLTHAEDLVAVMLSAAIGTGLILLVTEILQRRDRAALGEARLAAQVRAQSHALAQFQRALLPEAVPANPGLPLGWHYLSGGESAAPVGGDWYAFVPVSSSCLGVAIGDVAGHGLHAVRSMAEYRFALRTLAVDRTSPADVLNRLDEVSRLYHAEHYSTCLYGLLDVEHATWTYSSAGHLPPLLVRDGHAQVLPAPHGPPVGTGLPTRRYGCETVPLQEGDLIALYTDGLIETRDDGLDQGIARLAQRLTAQPYATDLSRLSADIVADLVGNQPDDDVALVLLRFTRHDTDARSTRISTSYHSP